MFSKVMNCRLMRVLAETQLGSKMAKSLSLKRATKKSSEYPPNLLARALAIVYCGASPRPAGCTTSARSAFRHNSTLLMYSSV